MIRQTRKGQSILEYTVLIITVAAAFLAMSVYMRRAVNDRMRDIDREANPGISIIKK